MAKKLQLLGSFPSGDGSSDSAIIDVLELPETDINSSAIYRLKTAHTVFNKNVLNEHSYICKCVDGLPEVGEPATNADLSTFCIYYNTADGSVSGYVPDDLAAGLGITAGWYPAANLFQVAGFTFGGVFTSMDDCPADDSICVLIGHEFHVDANGLKPARYDWNENDPASPAYIKNRPFYESDPAYDITWDGDTTDRFMFPLDAFDAPGAYLVKVSEVILSLEELYGSICYGNNGEALETTSDNSNSGIPGVVGRDDMGMCSVYDSAQVTEAMGGTVTIPTGTYFFYYPEQNMRMTRLKGPTSAVQIPRKYLDDVIESYGYQTSSQVRSIVTGYGYQTSSQVRSIVTGYGYQTSTEVDNKISEAIAGAIGGAY